MPDGTETIITPDGSQTPKADASGDNQQTRTYTAEEFKELISQRDKVKQERQTLQEELEKFRNAEAEKAKKDLEAKGSYDEIIKQKESELQTYKSKVEEQNGFIEAVRTDLLGKLSDEHKAIAGKLSLTDLQAYVKLNSVSPAVGTDSGKAGGATVIDITGKKWDEINWKDKAVLLESNIEGYKKLYKEKFGVMPSL